MKQYEAKKIKNIVLAGHGGCGKTSVAEAMMYLAGASERLGKVDDGLPAIDATSLGIVKEPGNVLVVEQPFVEHVVVAKLLHIVSVARVGVVKRNGGESQGGKVVAASASGARVEEKSGLAATQLLPEPKLALHGEVLGQARAAVGARRIDRPPEREGGGTVHVLTEELHAVGDDGPADHVGQKVDRLGTGKVVTHGTGGVERREERLGGGIEGVVFLDPFRLIPKNQLGPLLGQFLCDRPEPLREARWIRNPCSRTRIPADGLAVRRAERIHVKTFRPGLPDRLHGAGRR